jgi:hypothetical protein
MRLQNKFGIGDPERPLMLEPAPGGASQTITFSYDTLNGLEHCPWTSPAGRPIPLAQPERPPPALAAEADPAALAQIDAGAPVQWNYYDARGHIAGGGLVEPIA